MRFPRWRSSVTMPSNCFSRELSSGLVGDEVVDRHAQLPGDDGSQYQTEGGIEAIDEDEPSTPDLDHRAQPTPWHLGAEEHGRPRPARSTSGTSAGFGLGGAPTTTAAHAAEPCAGAMPKPSEATTASARAASAPSSIASATSFIR